MFTGGAIQRDSYYFIYSFLSTLSYCFWHYVQLQIITIPSSLFLYSTNPPWPYLQVKSEGRHDHKHHNIQYSQFFMCLGIHQWCNYAVEYQEAYNSIPRANVKSKVPHVTGNCKRSTVSIPNFIKICTASVPIRSVTEYEGITSLQLTNIKRSIQV